MKLKNNKLANYSMEDSYIFVSTLPDEKPIVMINDTKKGIISDKNKPKIVKLLDKVHNNKQKMD
jgi:hypothetical protein